MACQKPMSQLEPEGQVAHSDIQHVVLEQRVVQSLHSFRSTSTNAFANFGFPVVVYSLLSYY